MKSIHKFNGSLGATLCNQCSVIITTGLTDDLYCEECKDHRKKLLIEIMKEDEALGLYIEQMEKEEPKQDTLEEAKNNAWDNYEYVEGNLYSTSFKNGFEQGAKSDAAKEYWFNKFQEQDKNKYSEDEVLEQLNILMSLPSSTLDKFTDDNGNITMKWFEQIKKK